MFTPPILLVAAATNATEQAAQRVKAAPKRRTPTICIGTEPEASDDPLETHPTVANLPPTWSPVREWGGVRELVRGGDRAVLRLARRGQMPLPAARSRFVSARVSRASSTFST
jgi:hypothetical protein